MNGRRVATRLFGGGVRPECRADGPGAVRKTKARLSVTAARQSTAFVFHLEIRRSAAAPLRHGADAPEIVRGGVGRVSSHNHPTLVHQIDARPLPFVRWLQTAATTELYHPPISEKTPPPSGTSPRSILPANIILSARRLGRFPSHKPVRNVCRDTARARDTGSRSPA